ncbi:MAG: glycosyltransferase family 4 protein [Thermodesulfobacteriota bacterium]|nr:glycosyltransferase family 4 protein [Thermodesulfobacteriota bacterium]
MNSKVILVANTGFALHNFRLPLMKYLSDRGWEVALVANDEADYAAIFGKLGYRFIDIAVDHKGKNPMRDLLLTLRLSRLYEQEAPRLVHHFTIKPVIFGTLAARLANVPAIVNTITGLGYVFLKGGLLGRLVAGLYKIALYGRPRVIFQNSDDYRFFVSRRILKKRQGFIVQGSGVDTQKILPSRTKMRRSSVRFVLISRMLWSKGVKEYVTAAKVVKESYPQCEFIMAGGHSGGGATGNPESVPMEWLRETNKQGIVKWVGRVPYEAVMKLLDQASVIVLPSYREGVPKSLIEAAATGKPIITTDVPGCREVVQDCVNGFLVPVKDVDALVDRMVGFIRKPDLAEEMGKESRKRAEALFDGRIVLAKTALVYGHAGVRLRSHVGSRE